MPSRIELKATLRNALLNDPDVMEIADGVFSAHGREAEKSTREQPTVIFEFRGGRDYAQAPVGRQTVHLYAYSVRSDDEAGRLYEAAKSVLQRTGLRPRLDSAGQPCGDVCAYPIETEGAFDGWNDQMSAWFVRGTWQIWGMGG